MATKTVGYALVDTGFLVPHILEVRQRKEELHVHNSDILKNPRIFIAKILIDKERRL